MYEGQNVQKVIDDLMSRHKRGEVDESWIK